MAKKGKLKKDQRKMLLVFGITVASVLVITIAYAALSSTLNITFNKVTQNAIPGGWNVFVPNNITVAAGGTSSTGRSCGAATSTSTTTVSTITIADTVLSKPDDSCTWTITVQNTGGLDATLSSIAQTAPSGITCTASNGNAKMVCGNITYSLATNTDGSTFLATGGTLAKTSGTQKIYLIAKYTGTTVNTSAVTHSGAKFTLVYGQK